MNVFVDLHHIDLYYSLHCLFEKRLGWNLYRPTGLEWENEGYWKLAEFHNEPQFSQFMLDTGGFMNHQWIPGWNYKKDNIYYLFDPIHEYYNKAVTLEQFKDMKFDIIISSVTVHDTTYKQLRDRYQPNAKLICHAGNVNQKTDYLNVMHSVAYTPKKNQNTVLCHQELDKNLYQNTLPDLDSKNIYSVVHFLPYSDTYFKYKKALVGVNMRAYGGHCPDGGLFGARGVSSKMREANIGWHLKPDGGLGHSAMGWFASGRPIITNMSQHRNYGDEALRMFEPGVTCLDIEPLSVEDGVKAIMEMLEPENQIRYSENAYRRFNLIINYDEEEFAVRKFMENLL